MTQVKKTYGEMLGLVQALNISLRNGANTIGEKKLQKIAELVKKYIDEYNEKLEDIRLDNASVDDKGNLVLDDKGGYAYTKDATKKLKSEVVKLIESEFDFELVQIYRPSGLEKYVFLKDFVEGMEFEEVEQDEEEIQL